VHQAVRCLVDWLGCTLAGSATDEAARVRAGIAALDPGDGSRTGTIVGARQRAAAGYAALANGISAHLLDFDDTFNPDRTTIHGSAPLWPAILAAAELVPVTGEAAIAAFVAGFEVQTRVAVAAGPGHYDVGWHVTGNGRAHRRRRRDVAGARAVYRADPRRSGYRRHPECGHEGGVRVDGQVATRGQGRDGRAAVGIPGPRRLHVQHGTR
jgi:hypothetical protein